MQPIYLDYNATTPVDSAVAEAMQPYMLHHYGNPSSTHAYGRATKEAVQNAHAKVAALLGCAAPEVVFTSGGSESNNTVLKGVAYTYLTQRSPHYYLCDRAPGHDQPLPFPGTTGSAGDVSPGG